MIETANILRNATPRSLLVLDEIGRGTSTFDGIAVARAVVEHLHDSPRLRCKTLFATHYHELADLADELPGVASLQVEVLERGDGVVFLHRVVARRRRPQLRRPRRAPGGRAGAGHPARGGDSGRARARARPERQPHRIAGWRAVQRPIEPRMTRGQAEALRRLASLEPLRDVAAGRTRGADRAGRPRLTARRRSGRDRDDSASPACRGRSDRRRRGG